MAVPIGRGVALGLLLYVILQMLLLRQLGRGRTQLIEGLLHMDSREHAKWKSYTSYLDAAKFGHGKYAVLVLVRADGVYAEVVRPKAWLGQTPDEGFEKDVPPQSMLIQLFTELGYEVFHDDWPPVHRLDFVWSQISPYSRIPVTFLTEGSPNVKLLHFPRHLQAITARGFMLDTFKADFIPPAFRIPHDLEALQEYILRHPKAKFVRAEDAKFPLLSADSNRAIIGVPNGTYSIQAVPTNHFIIAQRSFELRVYVIVTSLNPTRFYIYTREWSLRVCESSLAAGNDTFGYNCETELRNMFSLAVEPNLQRMHSRLMFHSHRILSWEMNRAGISEIRITEQIQNIVRMTLREGERMELKTLGEEYPTVTGDRHFLEYLSYDLQIDASGFVHLLQVSHIPDLDTEAASSELLGEPVAPNRRLEDVFSLFGGRLLFGTDSKTLHLESRMDIDDIMVPERELYVNAEVCTSDLCMTDCSLWSCGLCARCISAETKRAIADAYLEHVNGIVKWSRIFAVTFQNQREALNWNIFADPTLQTSSDSDKLLALWFHAKCLQEYTWCI